MLPIEHDTVQENSFDELFQPENVRAIMFCPPTYAFQLPNETGYFEYASDGNQYVVRENGRIALEGISEVGGYAPVQHQGAHHLWSVFYQLPDGDEWLPPDLNAMLQGVPVATKGQFCEKFFPDHAKLAMQCPNMPVVLDYCHDRKPPRQGVYIQLFDHRVLRDIRAEDKKTRLPAPLTNFSLVWGLLDNAFGMHGMRMQLEEFDRMGMGKEDSFPDSFAYLRLTLKNSVLKNESGHKWRNARDLSTLKAAHVAPALEQQGKRDNIPTADLPSKTNKGNQRLYAAKVPAKTFKVQGGCLINSRS